MNAHVIGFLLTLFGTLLFPVIGTIAGIVAWVLIAKK